MFGPRALLGSAIALIAVIAAIALSDPSPTQQDVKVEPAPAAPAPVQAAAEPEPPPFTTIVVVRGIERNVYNNVIKEPAGSRQPR